MPYVFPLTFLVLALFVLANSLRILREYERGVVFRLGRYVGIRGPGLIVLIPFIERMVRMSLRTIAMDVEPQDVITRDNVSVRVNAVLYFRVMEPEKSVIEVEDFLFATSQLAQTTLRSVVGQAEHLDEVRGFRAAARGGGEQAPERMRQLDRREGKLIRTGTDPAQPVSEDGFTLLVGVRADGDYVEPASGCDMKTSVRRRQTHRIAWRLGQRATGDDFALLENHVFKM